METRMIKLTLEKAEDYEETGLVEFRGFSGIQTDADTAMDCPELCQMHSSAGIVYNLTVLDEDTVLAVPVSQATTPVQWNLREKMGEGRIDEAALDYHRAEA